MHPDLVSGSLSFLFILQDTGLRNYFMFHYFTMRNLTSCDIQLTMNLSFVLDFLVGFLQVPSELTIFWRDVLYGVKRALSF